VGGEESGKKSLLRKLEADRSRGELGAVKLSINGGILLLRKKKWTEWMSYENLFRLKTIYGDLIEERGILQGGGARKGKHGSHAPNVKKRKLGKSRKGVDLRTIRLGSSRSHSNSSKKKGVKKAKPKEKSPLVKGIRGGGELNPFLPHFGKIGKISRIYQRYVGEREEKSFSLRKKKPGNGMRGETPKKGGEEEIVSLPVFGGRKKRRLKCGISDLEVSAKRKKGAKRTREKKVRGQKNKKERETAAGSGVVRDEAACRMLKDNAKSQSRSETGQGYKGKKCESPTNGEKK